MHIINAIICFILNKYICYNIYVIYVITLINICSSRNKRTFKRQQAIKTAKALRLNYTWFDYNAHSTSDSNTFQRFIKLVWRSGTHEIL